MSLRFSLRVETEENIISWARQVLDCFGAAADIKELEILFLLREKHKHNPLTPEWENESWRGGLNRSAHGYLFV